MFHRLALVALALALFAGAAAALAVGGGAGPATAGATVDVVNDSAVSLAPASGPNGDYASLTPDDELVLDLDDLNDEAHTTAHEVFVIESTASQPIAVSVHTDVDGVAFYWASDPTTNATEARTLAPNESIAVGVFVDTHESVEDGNFTVRAEAPTSAGGGGGGGAARGGQMTIENVTVEPRQARTGETVTVTVTVLNRDQLSQGEEFRLLIDGRTVERQVARAWGGETTRLVFERTFQQPGEYDVRIDLHDAGSVTVTRAPGGSGFEVTNASVAPAIIGPGESATVSADVGNLGDETGTFRAELSVGGTVVDTRPVEIPAGATVRVSFERTFDRRGGYEVAIGGQAAGTVQVESATGSVVRRYGSQYGWLVGVFSAPVGAGALVAVRRRRRTPA